MKQRFSKRTRLVSALLTLAMVFTFLPFSAFAETEDKGIEIKDTNNFPDKRFVDYIRQYDTITDGYLSKQELDKVTEMNLGPNYLGLGRNIESLKGIEHFTKLEILECPYNKITELDMSSNLALKSLGCYRNQLTQLIVSGNNELTSLSCGNNQLTALDVSSNPNLNLLSCRNNQLTSLDLSHNSKLMSLDCDNNQLTFLDLSNNGNLNKTMFKCSGNKYPITIDAAKRTFDLNDLPTGFDVNQTSGWVGGTVVGNTLKVNPDADRVTYIYDCGNGFSAEFELTVNDGTTSGGTTPGGSTGGGSTGGGSTGGGTVPPVTPPSGGGTTIPGTYQLTVTDGVATVNGKTGDVLNVEPGATVTLTADTTKFPDIDEFGWWEISPYGSVSDTLTGQYQRTATFMMPPENVSARAMSKTAGVSTGGDGGGDGAAILLVGGAAVAGLVGYGVYSYVSEQQLKALLPEGVAMPENRAQTALLLWNTAGRPEPAAQPAFPDVADPDTAKAAQWCVEQGLMNAKFRGRFAPDGSSPAYKTLNAYRQLVG